MNYRVQIDRNPYHISCVNSRTAVGLDISIMVISNIFQTIFVKVEIIIKPIKCFNAKKAVSLEFKFARR